MTTDIIFRISFWVLLGGVLVMRVYFMLQVHRARERLMPDRAAIKREGQGLFLFRFIGFFALLFILFSYALYLPWIAKLAVQFPAWLRGLGFGVGIASLTFWAWVQAALGKHWSAQFQLREGHQLVTSGPYARIRHPLYTAMLGISIAFALTSGNWILVAFVILAVLGIFLRVPREEQMLLDEFGEQYRAYMQRTGRFFPRWN